MSPTSSAPGSAARPRRRLFATGTPETWRRSASRAAIDFGWIKLTGALAWWLWGFAHIYFLIGLRNRLSVALNWLWIYARDQARRATDHRAGRRGGGRSRLARGEGSALSSEAWELARSGLEQRMRSLTAAMLAGCIITSAYAQDVHDGAQAVEPLRAEQPPAAPPGQNKNMDCDFEHHCYSDSHSGGSSASANPAAKYAPQPPQSQATDTHDIIVHPGSPEDSQILREYAGCMGQAVESYNQFHDLNQFAKMSGACHTALDAEVDRQGPGLGADPYLIDRTSRPRRDIGCGFWPAGSDADRACAAGRFQ